MNSQDTHRWLLTACLVLLGISMPAQAWPWTNMDWIWEIPDHPHYQDITVPDGLTVNDLKIWLPHPPVDPDPFVTGMPYNDDYNYNDGTATFGPGGSTFYGGSNVGVTWTSKFAGDVVTDCQFTYDNSPVGEQLDLKNISMGYAFDYDDVGKSMTVSVTNNGTLDATYTDMRLAFCIPVEHLETPGQFHEDPAYLAGTPVSVLTSGSILVGQTLVIGSFPLDDDPGVNLNNNGYILADATFAFADGSEYRYATGGYGVPEPATLSLLGIGGIALLRRKR
jgi:hypothetical protein